MKRKILLLLLVIVMIVTSILVPGVEMLASTSNGMGGKVITGGQRDFKWPVPSNYNIMSCFLDPDAKNNGERSDYHYAIDISATTGTNVVAAYAGTVIKAVDGGTSYYGDGFGNYVVIQHTYKLYDGSTMTLYTRYSHLNSVSVSQGTTVTAGTTIGKVGSTGFSYGSHLDFQILRNGWNNYKVNSIDPFANDLLELPSGLYKSATTNCCGNYISAIKNQYANEIGGSSPTPTITAKKISFDLRGGTVATAVGKSTVTGFNVDRGSNNLIIYNMAKSTPGTNSYGVEVAVDSNGCVTQRRDYGSSTQLTVPTDGFVLSGQGTAGDFVNRIQVGEYVGYTIDKNKNTIAYYYAEKNEYLFNHKSVKSGEVIGELPVPTRDGYEFLGWYTTKESGNVYPVNSSLIINSDLTLYAHWAGNVYKGNRITFEVQGGTVPVANNQIQVTNFNTARSASDIIIYNESGSTVNTTKYGMEMAVNNVGQIVSRRDWGSETLLSVPTGGFILSVNSGCDAFYSQTEIGDYIGYITEEDGSTYAYHYKNRGDYIYHHKYVSDDGIYGGLPVVKREGYLFDGWYTDSERNEEIKWDTLYSVSNLYAHWVKEIDAEASVVLTDSDNNRVYKRYDYVMSWNDAKAYCESLGGHLVTITSQEEQDFIINEGLLKNPRRGQYAIGATDEIIEGVWQWVTGEEFVYSAWDQSNPEPSGGNSENYATIMAVDYAPNNVVGEWIDLADLDFGNAVYATSNMGFICEFVLEETTIENPFIDVNTTDYYHTPVLWAVEKGITDGWTPTQFAPNMACTRGQVVTFLWRAAGQPKVTTANPFTDVAEDAYYYDAVLWAVENGITDGWTQTQFAPDMECTRGQIVTFLWRAAGHPGVATGTNPFADVAVNAYYYEPILWAVKEGITDGWTQTQFAPDMTCTRGQIVTFLYRYHN